MALSNPVIFTTFLLILIPTFTFVAVIFFIKKIPLILPASKSSKPNEIEKIIRRNFDLNKRFL